MIKLDLSKMKHVKSDDKTTTLQHKEGHTITLAHKALSPEGKKQLQALADIAKNNFQVVLNETFSKSLPQ